MGYEECCALFCTNTHRNKPNVRFFICPTQNVVDKWKRWTSNIQIKQPMKSRMWLCSDHFEESCFTSTLKTRLNKFATPSIQVTPETSKNDKILLSNTSNPEVVEKVKEIPKTQLTVTAVISENLGNSTTVSDTINLKSNTAMLCKPNEIHDLSEDIDLNTPLVISVADSENLEDKAAYTDTTSLKSSTAMHRKPNEMHVFIEGIDLNTPLSVAAAILKSQRNKVSLVDSVGIKRNIAVEPKPNKMQEVIKNIEAPKEHSVVDIANAKCSRNKVALIENIKIEQNIARQPNVSKIGNVIKDIEVLNTQSVVVATTAKTSCNKVTLTKAVGIKRNIAVQHKPNKKQKFIADLEVPKTHSVAATVNAKNQRNKIPVPETVGNMANTDTKLEPNKILENVLLLDVPSKVINSFQMAVLSPDPPLSGKQIKKNTINENASNERPESKYINILPANLIQERQNASLSINNSVPMNVFLNKVIKTECETNSVVNESPHCYVLSNEHCQKSKNISIQIKSETESTGCPELNKNTSQEWKNDSANIVNEADSLICTSLSKDTSHTISFVKIKNEVEDDSLPSNVHEVTKKALSTNHNKNYLHKVIKKVSFKGTENSCVLSKDFISDLKSTLRPSFFNIFLSQIKNSNKPVNSRTWSNQDKKFALDIYLSSPETYKKF